MNVNQVAQDELKKMAEEEMERVKEGMKDVPGFLDAYPDFYNTCTVVVYEGEENENIIRSAMIGELKYEPNDFRLETS